MRWSFPFALSLVAFAAACVGESPGSNGERCVAADERVRGCIEAYCATAPADDPMCLGGESIPAATPECSDRDATTADRYAAADCDAIVDDLRSTGGKADGFCPRWLCWLCDCEEETVDCCVQCASDPVEVERCTGCFETYGRDSDGDGTNDEIWSLYCTRCGGCLDRNCDGTCD